jgi:Fe-S-cluster-containing dehydrogenase component
MAREGRLPFCAQACPNGAIYYGDWEEDVATNGDEVVMLAAFLASNSAYRYKEELGTKPRVYYIPGHGQEIGRTPERAGRLPTKWPWVERLRGAKVWKRNGR